MATLEIELKPQAKRHIADACSFYASESDGRLVEKFLRSLDEALARIQKFPESCPIFHRNARRILLDRFPYSVYYRITGNAIVVFAVLHGKRNPDYLRRQSL